MPLPPVCATLDLRRIGSLHAAVAVADSLAESTISLLDPAGFVAGRPAGRRFPV